LKLHFDELGAYHSDLKIGVWPGRKHQGEKMENKILEELIFVRERGALLYEEVRYLLIRPETLVTLQKTIEKELGEKASQILYQSGFQGGSLSSNRYREVLGLSDEKVIQFMMDMGPQIGWGRFELEQFNPSRRILAVKVHHSPFAEVYGTSTSPVCHFTRGVLGGMAATIFSREVESRESECFAKGDECCRFEIM
jgi:predicted hydrocarbon binding protein